MEILIIGLVLVVCIITVTLVLIHKLSKDDINLEVTATSEGKNELNQAIMKIDFTFSIGRLAHRKKEIIGSIDWSEGWMPVCYNLKEKGIYRDPRLLPSTNDQSYSTFEIDATNALDDFGRGEGYVVLVLENPIQTDNSRAGVILAVTANMVTYQLSDTISWKNDFAVNH